MPPITWQNIQAPSIGEASRAMQVAQQSFNNGFGVLDRVLTDRQAVNQGMQERENLAKTLAFKELIAGADANQIAALQASGQLDAMRSGLDVQGRTAVLGAEEARTELLKTRGRNDITWNQGQERFSNEKSGWAHTAALRPLELEGKQLDVAGKKQEQGFAATRMLWDTTNQGQREAMFPLERDKAVAAIRSSNASANSSDAQAKESNARVKYMGEDRESARKAAQAAARTQFLRDTGNVYAEGVLTPGSAQELRKLLTDNKIGDPDAQNAMIDAIGKLQSVELDYVDANNKLAKKTIPVPLSVAKQALLSASGGFFWNTDNDWAQSATEALQAQMRQIVELELADKRTYKQNKVVFDHDQYMRSRLDAVDNPPTGGKRSK